VVPASPRVSKEWCAIQESAWRRQDLSICPVQLGNAELPPFLRKWQSVRLDEPGRDIEKAARDIADAVGRNSREPEASPSELERSTTRERFREIGRSSSTATMRKRTPASMTSPTKRHHLGSGALTLRRELSVFINCPFDEAFRPIFEAILFSTVCCGFAPRCAVESGSSLVPRMERIVKAIQTSKYAIHDLSRCRGEGEANLARFNMPLELGMSMAQRFGSASSQDDAGLPCA